MKTKRDRIKAGRLRGGIRKCRRCTEVWNKPSGVDIMICTRCQTHCPRCYVELVEGNRYKRKGGRREYICKACHKEAVTQSQGNAGFKKRDYDLVRNYGITAVEYDAMLKGQGGGCYICGKQPKEEQRRLSVDHLHAKDEKKRNPREKRARVRGLLCWGCNAAIGKFKDNVTHLRKAADYLEAWPAQSVLKEKSNG